VSHEPSRFGGVSGRASAMLRLDGRASFVPAELFGDETTEPDPRQMQRPHALW